MSDNEREPIGRAKFKVSAALSTDAWSDEKHTVGYHELMRFDVYDSESVGRAIGSEFAYVARALIMSGHVVGERKSLEAAAEAFFDAVSNAIEDLEMIEDAINEERKQLAKYCATVNESEAETQ